MVMQYIPRILCKKQIDFRLISIDDRKYKKQLKLNLGVELDDSCKTPKAYYNFGEDDIRKIYKQDEKPEIPFDPKMPSPINEKQLANALRRHMFNRPQLSEIRGVRSQQRIDTKPKQTSPNVRSKSSLGFAYIKSPSTQKKLLRSSSPISLAPLLKSSTNRKQKSESPTAEKRPASALNRKSNSPATRLKKFSFDLQEKLKIAS